MVSSPQRRAAHLERVLLVCGMQNSGKTTLLRHMYVDPRFGTADRVPNRRRGRLPVVALSRERCLYIRSASPHERHESLAGFLGQLERQIDLAWRRWDYWRVNIACAVQPDATEDTPDATTICEAIRRRFVPERMRLVQIDPTQRGNAGVRLSIDQLDRLREIPAEVISVDGRRSAGENQHPNGFLLADFFDFT